MLMKVIGINAYNYVNKQLLIEPTLSENSRILW